VGIGRVLLGKGESIREKALGSLVIDPGLPVIRARLLCVVLEMAVFSIVLGVVPRVQYFSSSCKKPMLITQVASYILLLVGGGLSIFLAVLVSA